MKGKVIDDYDSKINEYLYEKGKVVEVTELGNFKNNYAIYHCNGVDWIPKRLVKLKGRN